MAKPKLSQTAKTIAINIRVDTALKAAFSQAAKDDAAMHGTDYLGEASTLRGLMRDYVLRINSIKESANAQHAAKVLKRAGAVRG